MYMYSELDGHTVGLQRDYLHQHLITDTHTHSFLILVTVIFVPNLAIIQFAANKETDRRMLPIALSSCFAKLC